MFYTYIYIVCPQLIRVLQHRFCSATPFALHISKVINCGHTTGIPVFSIFRNGYTCRKNESNVDTSDNVGGLLPLQQICQTTFQAEFSVESASSTSAFLKKSDGPLLVNNNSDDASLLLHCTKNKLHLGTSFLDNENRIEQDSESSNSIEIITEDPKNDLTSVERLGNEQSEEKDASPSEKYDIIQTEHGASNGRATMWHPVKILSTRRCVTRLVPKRLQKCMYHI